MMTRTRRRCPWGLEAAPPERPSHARNDAGSIRHGLALPAAIITLGIIALLIAGSAFFATEELRAGSGALDERGALEAAEYGAVATLRDWDPEWNLSASVGDTLGARTYALSDGASATARAIRTSATTFWIVSQGTSRAPTLAAASRRVVGVFYRLALATADVPAVLTVRDSAEVRAGGLVTGSDTALAGRPIVPACAAGAPALAGIAAPDTLRICDGTCGTSAGNIRGAPPLQADARAADSLRYLVFGSRTWTTLTAAADVVLPPNATLTPSPAVAAGACVRSASGNWGDPTGTSACRDYYPVIWARGDVTLSGGLGQGVLLAEGDISLAAGARFTGLVVARDDIVIQSTGGTIFGAALAGDAIPGSSDHTIVGAGGLIRYSACGLQSALLGAATLQRVRQRAWAEFY